MRDALDLLQFLWPSQTNPLISLLRKSRCMLHPHPGHAGGPKPRAQQGEWGLWSPTDLDWNPAVSFASDATLSSLSLSFFSYKMGVRKVHTSLGDYKNYISHMWSTWQMALCFVKVHDRLCAGDKKWEFRFPGFSSWGGNTARLESRESGGRLPGFDYTIYFLLLAVWPWTSYLTILCFSFLLLKMELVVPTIFTSVINKLDGATAILDLSLPFPRKPNNSGFSWVFFRDPSRWVSQSSIAVKWAQVAILGGAEISTPAQWFFYH